MRIHVLSDLHLEFGSFEMPQLQADVRVLAGDIHTKGRGAQYACANATMPTAYIAGNHEFYGKAIPKHYDDLRQATLGSNVTLLENQELIIDDVRFLGCTLWTDFCLMGTASRDLTMQVAQQEMTDYKSIRVNPAYRKLAPTMTFGFHRFSLEWLKTQLSRPFDGKTVVVTHHAPSAKSLSPSAIPDLINSAYASDLDLLIAHHSIDLWIHGHTHHCVDYQIGGTRIVSNALGYPGDTEETFDPKLVISI